MSIFTKITTSLLNAKSPLSAEQLKFYHSMIIEYNIQGDGVMSVIGINLRNDVINVLRENNSQLTRMELLQSRMSNINGFEPIFIKASEDVSRFKGSKCDLFIFDTCMQYMLRPIEAIANAIEIATDVVCIVKNYASFKHRLHFALNGSLNFLETSSNWHSHNVIRPFGFHDFVKMCDEKHILIKHALYVNRNGQIKDAIISALPSNLYLDEIAFIISKL